MKYKYTTATVLVIVAFVVLIYTVSASASTADQGVLDMDTITPSSQLQSLARAIAKAEGFYVVGSIPNRANNPGDLELGAPYVSLASKVTQFPTSDAGWQALYKELTLIVTGASGVYTSGLGTSITDLASTWTGGDNPQAWANIVAGALGVTVDAPLSEVMA